MIHKVYKITNMINQKIYIGVTKDTLQNRLIQHSKVESRIGNSIKFYNLENFIIEEMYSFNTKEESYTKEAEIVNKDFLLREDVYNQKLGGEGGWDYLNNSGLNMKNHNYSNMCDLANKVIKEKRLSQDFIDNHKLKVSEGLKTYYANGGKHTKAFLGQSHSEKAKKKIGEANSIHQKGSKNSQFGMMWIYNLELKESKRIPKDNNIPNGWLKGRKIKF